MNLDGKIERLAVSREEARHKITSRIEQMIVFLESLDQSNSLANFIKTLYEYEKWNEYNEYLLKTIFVGEHMLSRYLGKRQHYQYLQDQTDEMNNIHLLGLIDEKQKVLESINNILDLCMESAEPIELEKEKKPIPSKENKKIFVVHGHDIGLKDSVARFLKQLKLEPIFIIEGVSEGKTKIENLEIHPSKADYVLVLLSTDDVGALKGHEKNQRPRPAQDVILELGYFYGSMGKNRVCALYKDDLELPSNVSGILWVRMDDAGVWMMKLAREMKAAGLDIDLNLSK